MSHDLGIMGREANLPVSSLKAAGLSWSIEASMSMALRHCWQDNAGRLSLAMLARDVEIWPTVKENSCANTGLESCMVGRERCCRRFTCEIICRASGARAPN